MSSLKCNLSRTTVWKEFHFFDQPNLDLFASQSYIDGWDYVHDEVLVETGVDEVVKFEATPIYQRLPMVPCRIKQLLPDAKIVLVLREPTERLISNFKMMYGKEQKAADFSLYQWVLKEVTLLRDMGCAWQGDSPVVNWRECFGCEFQRDADNPTEAASSVKYCFRNQLEWGDLSLFKRFHTRYVSRGMYAPMIAWWLEYFHTDNFLILNMQEIVRDPIGVANRVAKFVGSDAVYTEDMLYDPDTGEHKDFVPSQHEGWREPEGFVLEEMERARELLVDFYAPLNEQLYRLLDAYNIPFERFQTLGEGNDKRAAAAAAWAAQGDNTNGDDDEEDGSDDYAGGSDTTERSISLD